MAPGCRHKWLVTVAVENTAVHDDAESRPPTELCLFQVELNCRVSDGSVLPYPSSGDLSEDAEDQELRLLYRHRRAYGAGMAAQSTGRRTRMVSFVRSRRRCCLRRSFHQ